KTVGITIPCVVGPYASVSCTASLLASTVRISPSLAGGYARNGDDAARFADRFGAIESIVTSGGNRDSGLVETNLRDDRFLPFEGCGAIGTWRLQLPSEFPQFDRGTISDAIVHVRYTAREGGAQLREAAVAHLASTLAAENEAAPTLLLSIRSDYPGEWQRFLAGDPLTIPVARNRFSYIAQGRTIAVQSMALVSLDAAAPVPAAVSASEVGLD